MPGLLWAFALPVLGHLAVAGQQTEQDLEENSCFLQTDRWVSLRPINSTQPTELISPPDVLKYAAPRDEIRQEAAAAKEVSTATMVGVGAAVLVAMIVLNYMLGRNEPQDVSKDVARDDKAPQTWRMTMAVMILCMYLLNYADRYNISVAILEMADERSYSKKTQGFIQSAVYMGLIPGGPISGYLASPQVCGPYRVLILGCIVWSVCTLLTPICGDTNLTWLILVRVGLGFGESVSGPCMYQLCANWFPKHQQARSAAMGVAGQCLGAAMAMTFSHVTEQDWRIMFYVFGSIGLLWSLIFAVYGSSDPSSHCHITDEERVSIEAIKRLEPPTPPPLPYSEILRHRCVHALIFMEFMVCFIWFLWLSWMPSFFHDNFNMSTGEAGTMGLIAYWLAAPAAMSWAELSEQCYRGRRWTLRQCRLYMAAVTTVVSGIPSLLLLVLYTRTPTELSVALVVIIVVTVAAKGAGHTAVVMDVGGASNSARVGGCLGLASASMGAAGNLIVGFFLDSPSLGWNSVLLASGVCGLLGFAYFATNLQVQPISGSS